MRTEPPSSLVNQVFELLSEHCAAEGGGRATFVAKVNRLLADTTLSGTASVEEIWRGTWDKPLYANQDADVASKTIAQLNQRQGGSPFAEFRTLRGTPEDLRGLRAHTRKFAAMGNLADAWEGIFELHEQARRESLALLRSGEDRRTVVDKVRRLLGVPGYGPRQGTMFAAIKSLEWFGDITPLHILTDLGYPVYKPDRWLVRFAAANPNPNEETSELMGRGLKSLKTATLLRKLDVVARGVDVLTEDMLREGPPAPFDLSQGFRAYRFADLMLAKFGMRPQEDYGLARSGKQALMKDAALARRYPELAAIARDMDALVKAEAKQAARRARARAAEARG